MIVEAADSNKSKVWLSGGVPLSAPTWTRVGGKANRIWKTDLSRYELEDVVSLRVDGRRVNPARYPNANPEVDFWPKGYIASSSKWTDDGGDWTRPKIKPSPNPAFPVNITGRPWDQYFTNYTGGINGTCAIYDPPFSYWCSSPPFSTGCGGCFTWNIPSGIETRSSLTSRPGWPFAKPVEVQVMAWRAAHWANWAFETESINASTGRISFGKGGFQGARGGPGSDWFVQNVYEELDDPNEFYFDKQTKVLYVFANETNPQDPPAASKRYVVIPSAHHTLLATDETSKEAPIRNLTIRGLGFRDTAWTMLMPHGVPSGGDWALERMAALFLEGTEGLVVENCDFNRIGGNALMLSKYHRHATVSHNSFSWLGGTAIALWGWTDELTDGGIHGIDGTAGIFPRYTRITENVFREIGVWEKQSSAVFCAKSAQTSLERNVVFNLGRAGFNFNDGFGGGDVIKDNVLFNTCRESSDHGPINSWDRQPFVTTVRNGLPSALMAWREVRNNLIVANYGGSKEVDNDDGSLFWRVHNNVMVYGWGQKFKCGAIESHNNLKLFIDLGGKFDAGCLLDPTSKVYEPNLWYNDSMVVLQETGNFAYRQCWGKGVGPNNKMVDYDRTRSFNNTIYVPSAKVQVQISGGKCPGKTYNLSDFQSLGEDPGTRRIVGVPSTDDLLIKARKLLAGN